jgi:hypothetical protein
MELPKDCVQCLDVVLAVLDHHLLLWYLRVSIMFLQYRVVWLLQMKEHSNTWEIFSSFMQDIITVQADTCLTDKKTNFVIWDFHV